MRYNFAILAASALLTPIAQAVNTIEVSAQEFVDSSSGKRFEVVGVDYQPGGQSAYNPASGQDVLSQPAACLRDAALLQSLGVNTIRSYNVDPYINHDECASIFNQAGIYMIIDVNSPLAGESIDRDDPASTYDASYLNRTFAILDAFRNYPNTLGFFSANELINADANAATCPPYIRAVTRDLKQYLQARGGRQIPVGYSAADVRDVLVDTANYVQCTIGGSTTTDNINSGRSDFFGLNSYSWCNGATFDSSQYNLLASYFANTTIPVFFSEFGCNTPSPRDFNEIPALYGSMMTGWSGGLVYEWTEEGSDFGLVQVNSDGSLTIRQDYVNLQAQYNALDLSILQTRNASAATLALPVCNADLINGNTLSNDFTLPAQPSGVASLISNGAPGATTGKIVSVTSTAINVVVTPLSGAAVTSSLSITAASSANTPDGSTAAAGATSTATATASTTVTVSGSAGAASATSTGMAAPTAGANAAAYGAGVAGLMLLALA